MEPQTGWWEPLQALSRECHGSVSFLRVYLAGCKDKLKGSSWLGRAGRLQVGAGRLARVAWGGGLHLQTRLPLSLVSSPQILALGFRSHS